MFYRSFFNMQFTFNHWIVLLFAATSIAFSISLFSGFVFDDIPVLIDNPNRISEMDYLSFFKNSVWDHTAETSNSFIYRPMFMIYMAISQMLWEDQPFGYHLISLLLHSVNSILFLFILRKIYPQTAINSLGFASLFFAIHPSHVESVNWISGVTDIQLTFFIFVSFLAYQNYTNKLSLLLSYATFFLALLSKEVAVTFPLVLVLQDILIRKHTAWGSWIIFTFLIVIYFSLRASALGESAAWSRFDLTDITPALEAIGHYIRHSIFPWPNTYYHSPPDSMLSAYIGWIIIIIFLFFMLVDWQDKNRGVLLGGIWFAITLAPALALSLLDNPTFAQRFLYLPLAGTAIAIAGVIVKFKNFIKFRQVILLLYPLVFVLACWQASVIWISDKQFYFDAAINSKNMSPYVGLGAYISRTRELDLSRQEILTFIQQKHPRDEEKPIAIDTVATILAQKGQIEISQWLFEQLTLLHPTYYMGWMGRGNIALLRKDYRTSAQYYIRALDLSPKDPQICRNASQIISLLDSDSQRKIISLCENNT